MARPVAVRPGLRGGEGRQDSMEGNQTAATPVRRRKERRRVQGVVLVFVTSSSRIISFGREATLPASRTAHWL